MILSINEASTYSCQSDWQVYCASCTGLVPGQTGQPPWEYLILSQILSQIIWQILSKIVSQIVSQICLSYLYQDIGPPFWDFFVIKIIGQPPWQYCHDRKYFQYCQVNMFSSIALWIIVVQKSWKDHLALCLARALDRGVRTGVRDLL